jgi:hypothetical protein
MNCEEIQRLFGEYWDLPEGDQRRLAVDRHIRHCPACAAEFTFWEESADLIRKARAVPEEVATAPAMSMSGRVMSRIYEAESWRIPVPERMYLISDTLRRNATAIIACCLVLFLCGFVYSFISGGTPAETNSSKYGFHPVASAASASDPMNVYAMPTAVASLSDPFLLKTGPIQSFPEYLLAISILGVVSTLLIMNWLSRTKC